MIRALRAALAAFAIAFCCAPALAQSSFPAVGGSYVDGHALMCPNGSTDFQGRPVMAPCGGASNPVNTTGSFSASVGGFILTPSYSTGTTSASDQTVALPTGTEFILTNNGSSAMAWNIGAAATGTMNVLQPNSWIGFAGTGGAAFHYIEATGAAGTSAFSISGGAGLPTGAGGGGGGSPGGGVVTQPTASLLNATVVSGPDVATNTPITVQDVGTTCASTPAPIQTQCTGTATAGSVASVAVAGQQGAAVVASLTSGTVATVSFSSEFSWDGGATWYGRGLFLDSNVAPIWKNGIANNVFSGSISVPPGATNYRVRAATLTGTSPNINIKIILSQSNSGTYVYNLPTAAAGISSVSAVDVQFEAGSLPFDTNAKQLAGTALGGPTVWGTAPTGAQVPGANVNCVTGCSASTVVPFTPTGNTLAAPLAPAASSVSSIAAPTGGASVLVTNTGTALGYIRLTVGTGTATANDIPIQAGAGCVLTLGSNTFINAFNVAAGSSFNASAGNGLGNCPTGGGGGGSSSVASDTNLTPSPTTISAVNNFSTGLQVQNWTNGRTTLTGTPTAGSAVGFTGLAGWNSGIVECQTGGAQGTNQYEIDVSGPSGGTVVRRVATFTGPTASIPINLAGQVFVNVVADQWSAGALACTMRVSVNQSVPDDWAVTVQADLDASGNFSSATTQLIAAIPGETIVVNSWDEFAPGSSSSDAKWHWAYGTGTNCGTGTTSKSSNRDFSGSSGLARSGGGGIGFTVPPGNALCVVIDTAPSTGTVGVDVSYANR